MNSILKTILNVLTPSTEPMPPMAMPTQPPAAAPKAPVPIGLIPSSALDAWAKKYTSPPYFKSAFSRKNLGWTTDPLPRVSNKIFTMVFEKAQPLFGDDDLQILAGLKKQWDLIDAKSGEINFAAVSKICRERAAQAGAKFLAGETPDAAGRQEVASNLAELRHHFHMEKMKMSQAIFDVLSPACERLSAAARELTDLWDKNERDTHELFQDDVSSAPFKPSDSLLGFIWVALDMSFKPVSNFKLCGFLAPPADLKNLQAMWFTPPVIQKVLTTTPAQVQADLAAESRKQLERQAQETDMAERKKQIAEKNELVEKVKRAAAENVSLAESAEAQREAAKEKRKLDALAKLNAPPAPPEPDKPAEPEKKS